LEKRELARRPNGEAKQINARAQPHRRLLREGRDTIRKKRLRLMPYSLQQ
jgi:hypothetical protein